MNMEIPEAIKVLKNFKLDMSQPDAFRMVYAIRMAEEVLKRQYIINEIDSPENNKTGGNSWIPVKEQLPERRGNYLATAESAGVRFRLISHYNAPGWTEEYGGQKIIAWQPLPELYGEEKDVGQ